ncbi:MAG: hypothetical protein ACTSPK_07570 [Candidatus Heimdallarchaeota archaeon]
MEVQDVITYNQKIVSYIKDTVVAQYFYDKDYGILLQFLRSGPKTLKEIEAAYQAADNEKSDKTIYRYIKDLTENSLVVEAGKRIFTDEQNKNKTVTIFMRTAKVFYDHTKTWKTHEETKDKDEKMNKIYNALKILLESKYEGKEFSVEYLSKIYNTIYNEGDELALETIEKTSDEVFNLLEHLDYSDLSEFLLNINWFLLVFDEKFRKDLDSYKK